MSEEEQSKQKRQIIIDFVQNHYGCSKTDLINYMRGEDREGNVLKEKSSIHLSQKPTENYLKILMSEEDGEAPKILMVRDPKNRQIHRLYINDKNTFIKLKTDISRMLQLTHQFSSAINQGFRTLKESKNLSYNLDLIHIAHEVELIFYSKIAGIASKIDREIKKSEDREILHNELVRILNMSDKTIKLLSPQLKEIMKNDVDKLNNDHKLNDDHPVVNALYPIVDIGYKLMSKSERETGTYL